MGHRGGDQFLGLGEPARVDQGLAGVRLQQAAELAGQPEPGEQPAALAADLGDLVPMRRLGTLEAALAAASADARAGDAAEAVVLLAPACASFDQFTSFEARGDRFRALAELAAREPAA